MQEEYMKLLERYRRECQMTGALKGLIETLLCRVVTNEANHLIVEIALGNYEYVKKAFGDEE